MHKFIFLILALTTSISTANNNLNDYINNQLKKLKISRNNVSIIVQKIGSNSYAASVNPNKAMTPASVVKIITTYSALEKLGPNYRWPTKFYTTGPVNKGKLKGNLVVQAFGNPDLISEDIPEMAAGIKAAGIKSIKGNIIIDQYFFRYNRRNWSLFDKNTYNPYNAMPAAMMFNHRATRIDISGNPATNKVYIRPTFADSSFRIKNNLKVTNKSCRGRYAWPRYKTYNKKGKVTIEFKGNYSSKCPDREVYRVLTLPAYSFFSALKKELKKIGVTFNGRLKFQKTKPGNKLIYTHLSRKLIDIVTKTNKQSNNLMARQIMLTLGGILYGGPATEKSGVRALKHILGKHNILDSKTKLSNGSGLSRTAKLTANSLNNLLQHAYKSDFKWMETLPIMGTDGTLRRRLFKTSLKGKAWMKTGSLRNVRSITGYVRSKSGNTYTVTILINDRRSKWPGGKLQDNIITWVHKNY